MFSQGFEVRPMKLYFDSINKNQTLTINNLTNESTNFSIFLNDYTKDSTGSLQLLPINSNKYSCSDDISFIPALIHIEANSSKTITVQYQNADSLLKWGMLIIKPLKSNDSIISEQSQIRIFPQIAVKLFCNNKKNIPIRYHLSEIQNIENQYEIAITNDNKNFQRFFISIIATNINTLKETEIRNYSTEFLPNSSRKINFSIPKNLDEGKYSIAFILKDEENNFLGGKEFSIDL